MHPPSKIQLNKKFKTLRWRLLRWRLTLSECSFNFLQTDGLQTDGSRLSRPKVEVPWAWETESRGQMPKSLKKVSKKSPGAGAQKSEKSLEKGPKSLRKPIFRLSFDFSDLFRDFFRTFGPQPWETFFRDFFETFWLRPRDSFSQVHGTSNLRLAT